MNLYYWPSNALADYSKGDIIVMAENVAQARKIALAEYRMGDSKKDTSEFEADLAKRPKVYRSPAAVLICGGG